MSSALKPVGVTTPPVSQQINKPLHPQSSPTTYGQPMSHTSQNLPHSLPANAHSNNIHSTNHYSGSISNASQQSTLVGSIPPPSNHPVANVGQPPAGKNITYNLNTNNVAHSYKMPTQTPVENTSDSIAVLSEESPIEQPQSNGTPEEKPDIQEEPTQSHQAESSKDKPPLLPQIEVPESPTIFEKSSETIIPITTPEKTAETLTTPEQKPSKEVETIPEVIVEEPLSLTEEPVVPEPIATSAPSVESISAASVTVTATDSVVPLQTEESPEVTSAPHLPVEPAESSPAKDLAPPSSNVNSPVKKPKEQIQTSPKPTLKLATTPRSPIRKPKPPPPAETPEQPKISKSEIKTPNQKSPGLVAKSKRTRTRTQPYQSPLPEVELISKISAIASTSKPKSVEDKLIVFYKNEFLAVRNSEGGFYICQALHNIYKSTRKIRILWLSQDKNDGDIYTPDFYDQTDFDCILTNINLLRAGKGKFKLPDKERIRTDSILKRALAVEKGDATAPCLTEEHPDGLDLSLYKEESQLKKGKSKKRKRSPLKTPKTLDGNKSLESKVRKIEPKPRLPPVKKSLVIKKALAVKAKETTVINSNKVVKAPLVGSEVAVTKTSPVIDPQKAKVLAKVVKKSTVVTPQPLASPSTSTSSIKTQPPRIKSTDTVVPFLRKEPPVLKREVPTVKKELLVLKKESSLKKEELVKREVPVKKNIDVKKDVPVVKKEMPVLKREVSLTKKEIVGPSSISIRKSNRGKK